MANLRISTFGCGRLFGRRNNTLKLVLVILLFGTCLWISILRFRIDFSDSRMRTKVIFSPEEKTLKDIPEKTWISDLNKLTDDRTSFFKREQFTDEALKKNGLIPVTAIMLNWGRVENLRVLNFKLNNTDVILNVFNSVENLQDLSKYIICSMAKYDYCYFQDDDWLNLYMDSVYINFLRSPSLIHSNTMPIIHLEHRRWTFSNKDKNLHTGFTWLGCGSFVPRAKVFRFLGQVGSTSLGRERLRLLDIYFSLWTNQYPYQLSSPLAPSDQINGWSNGVDQWSVVYANILDAVQKLYTALATNTDSQQFMRKEEEPYYSNRDVRCLFITNIDPFPYPSSVYYTNNITHVREQEAKFNALTFPSNKFWSKHAYHNAVDMNSNTCWNSFKIPKIDDYFGLQFVEPRMYSKITIVSSKVISNFNESFIIETSPDGNEWQICDNKSSSQDHTDPSLIPSSHSITMRFDCRSARTDENRSFGFIRLRTIRNFTEPIEICSLILDGLSV
ncbi:1037_t:CDS:2 [Acaulospora morrowiae]|uniref:1037_t:CDS:1 n=1 Tax=Acaulospora morrowiae TaxID=94023 RepID=A0A9N9GZY1_9GLOM|nr:1037_t:CDS:2 [Acaulospora morrowiae]